MSSWVVIYDYGDGWEVNSFPTDTEGYIEEFETREEAIAFLKEYHRNFLSEHYAEVSSMDMYLVEIKRENYFKASVENINAVIKTQIGK